MNRAVGIVAWLLVGVILLPAIAHALQGAVPALVSLLVVLGFLRLALPPSRRGRH